MSELEELKKLIDNERIEIDGCLGNTPWTYAKCLKDIFERQNAMIKYLQSINKNTNPIEQTNKTKLEEATKRVEELTTLNAKLMEKLKVRSCNNYEIYNDKGVIV